MSVIKKKKGFTVAELLVVVAIIGILVAVSIPIFTGRLEAAREATCSANKRSLYAEMANEYMAGTYSSLDGAFTAIYAEKSDEYVCPEGGTFYWADNGDTGRVRCTYHDDGQQGGDEEGGDTGETYPGTNLSLTPNIWPKAEDYVQEWDNITVPAGGIFKYTDGNYYVVTSNTTLTKGQALSGPGGDGHSWFSVQKITNRIVTYAEGEGQKSDLTRGDMCLYNGEYYVFKDGGSWGGSPGASPGQWYKIPS